MSDYKYNRKVETIFPGCRFYEGEVGVEIELEGSFLPRAITSYWDAKEDPSLRGEGMEYVMRKPCRREHILRFCKYLERYFHKDGCILNPSKRCSVHVHINTQGMTMVQVYNFVCLYLLVEDLLLLYAGEDRVGNMFCLAVKDAEALVDAMVSAIENKDFNIFQRAKEKLRYGSINITALPKFNSLEFRALRVTTDPDVITEWATLLLGLKDLAMKYETPVDIIKEFSISGVHGFLTEALGQGYKERLVGGVSQDIVEQYVWEAIPLVQEIAYCTRWDTTKVPDFRVFDRHGAGGGGNKELPPLQGLAIDWNALDEDALLDNIDN